MRDLACRRFHEPRGMHSLGRLRDRHKVAVALEGAGSEAAEARGTFLGVFTDLAAGASVIPDPELSWRVVDPTGLPQRLTLTPTTKVTPSKIR